ARALQERTRTGGEAYRHRRIQVRESGSCRIGCLDYGGQHPFQSRRNHHEAIAMEITRRHFFSRSSTGIGIAALGSLLTQDGFAASESSAAGGLPGLPHFPPTAKRV